MLKITITENKIIMPNWKKLDSALCFNNNILNKMFQKMEESLWRFTNKNSLMKVRTYAHTDKLYDIMSFLHYTAHWYLATDPSQPILTVQQMTQERKAVQVSLDPSGLVLTFGQQTLFPIFHCGKSMSPSLSQTNFLCPIPPPYCWLPCFNHPFSASIQNLRK